MKTVTSLLHEYINQSANEQEAFSVDFYQLLESLAVLLCLTSPLQCFIAELQICQFSQVQPLITKICKALYSGCCLVGWLVGCPLSRWVIEDVQVIQTLSRDWQTIKYSGKYLEHIENISGIYLGHISNISGTYLGL